MSAFNLAMSYNKKHAVSGTYPSQQLDYPNAVVSTGPVAPMASGTVRWTEDGLQLTWVDNSAEERAAHSDHLIVLMVFTGEPHTEFLSNGAYRDQCSQFIPLNPSLVGKPVHVYTAFSSYDGNAVSPSSYIGL